MKGDIRVKTDERQKFLSQRKSTKEKILQRIKSEIDRQ